MRKNKKKYVDEDEIFPSEEAVIIDDFLPPPEQLIFTENPSRKVTITLNESVVDFFKREANKHGSKYQTMIRVLLMKYVRLHDENPYKPKTVRGGQLKKKTPRKK